MKKLLALFLGVLTAISCFGAAALKLDTAEAELFMVTDDDELLYSPADKYGNLVGSISFDNGNGNTDGASFAPYLVSTSAVSATIDYVADPSGVRDGYVLKYTSPASTVNRLGISAADNAALGKYTLAFDVYLSAGSSDFAFMRADISAAQVNDFASKVNGTKGTWISCYLDFEIIEINGSTYTISYNGLDGTENNVGDIGANIWMYSYGDAAIYFDDIKLYHYPAGNAAFIDHYGNRVMADVSEMTAFPEPTDIIDYSNDDDFYAWVAEDGSLHMPGEAVEAGSLEYQTFTGLFKSCVYFVFGEAEGELAELDTIPYPSEVDSSWSDAGFYAWVDEDGVYYYPGEAASIAELADFTLTAVTIAEYNATLGSRKATANGILVAALDFDSEAYTDKAFADTVNAGASEGRGQVADPFNSGRGNVYNASSAGGHWAAVNFNAAFANGKVRFEIDTYTDASTYVMKQHEFHGADTSPYPTSIQNEWYTHISEFDATTTVNFTCFRIWNGAGNVGGNLYIDNFKCYFMPNNAVVFDNADGTQAIYYGNKNGNIVITAPSGVNANWSDEGFGGWTATNGTVYTVGDTVAVANLAGQVLKNEVTQTYFTFNGETVGTPDVSTIPYPSDLDSDWSDAGFYAWVLDGKYYHPGTAGSADLADKTLTAVTIADYNATLGTRKATANGILVAALDFDTEKYTDKVFANDVWAGASEGRGQIADPFNSGRGNVYNASSAGAHWAGFGFNASFANGKVRFEYDIYTDAATYVTKQHAFHPADTSPYPTSIQNVWHTDITEFTATSKVDFTGITIWNGAGDVGGNLYIDNFKCYFMPDNAVVFDNADGTQAIYYGDKNGNIVITAPSGVNANWSDEGFGGWTATNGTVYNVGDTVAVANLAGQVLKNEVTQTYFTFNGETVGTPDVSTIPYPSDLDSDWSDAGFYAWVLDGKYYRPGTAGSADLADKTLTAVTIADYNATLGTRKATEKGILVAALDFDSEAYTDKAFADTVNASASEGRGVVADPFNSGRGNVYNASSAGAHWAAVSFNATFANGKTRFEIDTYTDASSYVTKQHAFHPADTSPYPTSIQNEWYTHITEFEATDTVNFTGYTIWNGAGDVGGNLYIDNFKCYFMPDNAVVFDNADGSQAIYYGDKNGNITLPAPSGVNANWSDEGFKSWKASNGTLYNVGDVIAVADFVNQKFELVTAASTAPVMLNKASLRLTGVNGMRMASFVSANLRENAAEYGYIVSRKVFFADVDYNYGSNFVIPADFDTETFQGTLETVNKPFLCGIAYKPENGIDKIYTTDGSTFGDGVDYGSGVYYTCVLTGMEGYDQYHEVMVVRPYIKIGDSYFYGETMEKSLYEVALAYQQANGEGNAFVDGIVSATKD